MSFGHRLLRGGHSFPALSIGIVSVAGWENPKRPVTGNLRLNVHYVKQWVTSQTNPYVHSFFSTHQA